jgi:putative endonuclease
MSGYLYFMSNRKNGVIYTGVTTHLIHRTDQHKQGETKSFTQRYGLVKLVYYEVYDDIGTAIQREKQIKNWKREWKIALIEKDNLEWLDLYPTLNG